ncbi:hypothetical protein L0F63_000747 [Massospora cicadina]|nr:hypothetical protein L0F63_000747 [Massospora cicadina]
MDNSDCQTLKRQPSESPSQSPKRHLRYDTPLLSNAEYIAGLDANREKLKATFEDIIQRYSRDFGEEADEIDIFREEIVVDRGFLRNAPYYKFGRGKSLLNPVGNPIPLKEEFPGNDIKGLPLAFTGPKEALDASAGFLWTCFLLVPKQRLDLVVLLRLVFQPFFFLRQPLSLFHLPL